MLKIIFASPHKIAVLREIVLSYISGRHNALESEYERDYWAATDPVEKAKIMAVFQERTMLLLILLLESLTFFDERLARDDELDEEDVLEEIARYLACHYTVLGTSNEEYLDFILEMVLLVFYVGFAVAISQEALKKEGDELRIWLSQEIVDAKTKSENGKMMSK
jgi:hypothetical protein